MEDLVVEDRVELGLIPLLDRAIRIWIGQDGEACCNIRYLDLGWRPYSASVRVDLQMTI
jgi:hypothetical protein